MGTGDNFPRDKMVGGFGLQFISYYRIRLCVGLAFTVYS